MSLAAPSPTSVSTRPPAPRGGVFAALWLPTDAEGKLLREALRQNLDFLKRHGVTGVLALGSTGEFPGFPKDGSWTIRAEGLSRFP